MDNLDQWTPEKFKETEEDLLKKQQRRQEIPIEVTRKNQEIEICHNKNIENQKKLTGIEKEIDHLENALRHLNINYQNSLKPVETEYADKMESFRNQILMEIRTTESKIDTLKTEKNRYLQEIQVNQEKIRVLNLEITSLYEEDKRIITECQEYKNQFNDVIMTANEKTSGHIDARNQFQRIGAVSRFGRTSLMSGASLAEEKVNKYKKISETADLLMKLVCRIINESGNGASSETSSTRSDNGITFEHQDIMNSGYGNASMASIYNSGEENLLQEGKSDFITAAYQGAMRFDSSISSYDLDKRMGEEFGVSAEKAEQARRESGYAWYVEDDHISFRNIRELSSSNSGFTLDEWNEDSNTLLTRKKTRRR